MKPLYMNFYHFQNLIHTPFVDNTQKDTVLSRKLPFWKNISWILGNVTRIPRHELPQTLDFSDFLPLFT